MESQIPIHVKISTDRRRATVGVELDYGREALIRVVWTATEAMAVAGALAEAADELLRSPESAAARARAESPSRHTSPTPKGRRRETR